MTTQEFLPYLKTVGTGPKSNRDLSRDEMKTVMRALLSGEVCPEQAGAFLLGWRVKGESLDEFAASIEVFDEFVRQEPLAHSIEFGYPYDGKIKNPYLFPLTARFLKKHNLRLSLHGDLLQPPKGGTTLKEVCEGIPLSDNIHYYDRADYFKALHAFSDIRAKLGLRTSFNTIEKLLNITESETAVIGAFHKPFIEKYIKLYKDRYKRLVIIKGNEGAPEIFSKCSVIIVENDQIDERKVDPKDFGIHYRKSTQGISLETSLALTNDPSPELMKLAQLNAAVILFITQKVKRIEEGFALLSEG
ncbi:MAG: glycosyl transferase [Sulfurimonas sp.]